jgi:hypothetical protein
VRNSTFDLRAESPQLLESFEKNRKTKTKNKKEETMNTIQYLFAAYCHALLALLVLLEIGNNGARQSKPRVPAPRDPTITVSQQSRFC